MNGFIRLDTQQDAEFTFTYTIADISDPQSRKTAYSKTVRIPSTSPANEAFLDAFEITNEDTFNPNVRTPVSIYDKGLEVFRGDLKLLQVTRQGGLRYYECLCVQEVKTLYHELRNTTLGDLDLSDLNHALTLQNVSGSWSRTSGYVYPYIDYGDTIRNFPLLTQGGRPLEVTPLPAWRPALFYKTIWDRLFALAGFSYTSSFLTSSPFTKLIMPAVESTKLTNAQVSGNTFAVSGNTGGFLFDDDNYVGAGIGIAPFPQIVGRPYVLNNNPYAALEIASVGTVDATGEYDPSNSVSGFVFTAPISAYYNFAAKFSLDVILEIVSPTVTFPDSVMNFRVAIFRNGRETLAEGLTQVPVPSGTTASFSSGDLFASGTVYAQTTEPIFVNAGDKITAIPFIHSDEIIIASGLVPFNIRLAADISQPCLFYGQPTAQLAAENQIIDVKQVLPQTMKASEFLNGVIRAFNLYVAPDPTNPRNLIIEPRDNFYTSGVVDWTDKADISRPAEIKFASDFDFNKFDYNFTEDNDYYNAKYNQSYGIGFGDRREQFANEWTDTTRTIELPFAATPLVGGGQVANGCTIPRIYFLDQNGRPQQRPTKPRMLFYGGLKTGTVIIVSSGTPFAFTSYPYAGHLDDPFNPTLDLNFAPPREIYYSPPVSGLSASTIEYTNNNLYNAYHRTGLLEITDPLARVVSMHVLLDASDINQLDFRKMVQIKGTRYRLLSVNDYRPGMTAPVQVELLKIIPTPAFSADTAPVFGGTGGTLDGRPLPIIS